LALADQPRRHHDQQVSRLGYDNMTGVGPPDWPRFIAALRKLERQVP
jgi:hypothetical protein